MRRSVCRSWMLVVIIEHQQHVAIRGYGSDDDCTKAGMTMMTKAEALPWFCVIEPTPQGAME
jgi:hypothetical protein